MSYIKTNMPPSTSEPGRALRSDFTEYTLRHASVARQRAHRKQHIMSLIKGIFEMKTIKKLQTIPGVVVALVLIASGSAGAYALSNWFATNITVKQTNASVLTVDLSQCKGNLPPGVKDSSDHHNVQFKITGEPHISTADLQRKLLESCEYNSVLAFYRGQTATKDSLYPDGTIKNIGKDTITLQYLWGGKPVEKTFLASSTAIYDQGKVTNPSNLHAGDKVIFVVPDTKSLESQDPIAAATQLQSIFKTQYDATDAPGATKSDFYDISKIMPLDWYNQAHKSVR